MAKLIEQIEPLKAELRDKFLDYYKANSFWLKQMDGYGQSTKNSWFILGVISALEPKSELKELLQYFLLVTQNSDSIIKALELDFDPEIELKKRSQQQETASSEYLDKIREEIKT